MSDLDETQQRMVEVMVRALRRSLYRSACHRILAYVSRELLSHEMHDRDMHIDAKDDERARVAEWNREHD